jgi:hypothetical protein
MEGALRFSGSHPSNPNPCESGKSVQSVFYYPQRGIFMPDPTEIGERAFTAAQDFLRRGQDAAKRETRVIRLQTQISRMRSQRTRLLQQMGEKVFDLFQRELVKNQELRMMCQQVKSLDAEMELRREEIEQLRAARDAGEGGVGDDSGPSADLLDEEDEIIRG